MQHHCGRAALLAQEVRGLGAGIGWGDIYIYGTAEKAEAVAEACMGVVLNWRLHAVLAVVLKDE
jgi:hypothetical protein